MESKEKNDDLLAETPEAQQAEYADDRHGDALSLIQRRAYELWQERGGGTGRELDDWLQAEAEVNAPLGAPDPATAAKATQPDYGRHATAG